MTIGIQCVGQEGGITLGDNSQLLYYAGKFTGSGLTQSPNTWYRMYWRQITHQVVLPKIAGETLKPMAFVEVPYDANAGTPNTEDVAGAVLVGVFDGAIEDPNNTWGYQNKWLVGIAAYGTTPIVRIFRDYQGHTSGESIGVRLYDSANNVIFDSGLRFMWIHGYGTITTSSLDSAGRSPVNLVPVHMAGLSCCTSLRIYGEVIGESNSAYRRFLSPLLSRDASNTYVHRSATNGAPHWKHYSRNERTTGTLFHPYLTIDNSAFP